MTPPTIETQALSDIAALRVKLELADKVAKKKIYRELRRLTKQVADKLERKVK